MLKNCKVQKEMEFNGSGLEFSLCKVFVVFLFKNDVWSFQNYSVLFNLQSKFAISYHTKKLIYIFLIISKMNSIWFIAYTKILNLDISVLYGKKISPKLLSQKFSNHACTLNSTLIHSLTI